MPQPGWLVRAALASCTGTAIAMRAAKLGIAVEKLEVSVESESDNRGLLGLDQTISAALIGLRTIVRIRAANTTPLNFNLLPLGRRSFARRLHLA